MDRVIKISTEVFASIWANRQAGEEAEDTILRRILGLSVGDSKDHHATAAPQGGGVYDVRNAVQFAEGFEILRTYKRREFAARALAGMWVRSDNGQSFPTLNQLNASIAAGAENVWNGSWKYRAADGTLRSIAELRA